MFYFNTLNLIQISGGNQVKQGDFGSTFAYNLADEKSRELDIFDKKKAYVNLVLNDKIVFTTTAIVDKSTVTFRIDKAIPIGLYFLEIKIDSYIFPSDRQTIILVTAGSVAYDLKELVPNYDTNMTISSILSDLSQKGIDISDLRSRIDEVQLETTAQLARTNDNVKANSTYYSMSKEPVVTFIDDDGHVDVYNRLYPIFSAKGIKGCSAIITGSVDVDASVLTSSQLDDLHDYGWEFLGHGHSYTANLTEFPVDSDLEYQLGEGCKGWLENRGYPVNGFVYPQGVSNERIRRFTKKYYDFAFQGNAFNEGDFVDTTRIQRIAFGSWTSTNPTVNGNSEKNTLAYYKACVDYASANNIWLIFMLHVGQQDVSQDAILSDLITYIQSSNVKILTASEGYKKHGNKIFIGDKDSDYLAINENGLYSNNIYPSCELKQDTKYLTDGINSYASGMSVMLVSYAFGSANGFPGNTSGVLITYRFSTKYAIYNKQEFLQNISNRKYVRYALTDTTWSAFEEIMTSASAPYKMAGINAYTASSPITEYPANSIVTFPVNFSGSTGFGPTQSAGVVTVYRIHGNGWDRREFRKNNSNEIYASYVDGSTGQWSSPVKISAV